MSHVSRWLRCSLALSFTSALVGCGSSHTTTLLFSGKQDALVQVDGSRPTVEINVSGTLPITATTTQASGGKDKRSLTNSSFMQTLIHGGQILLQSDGEGRSQVEVVIRSHTGVSIMQPAPKQTR